MLSLILHNVYVYNGISNTRCTFSGSVFVATNMSEHLLEEGQGVFVHAVDFTGFGHFFTLHCITTSDE